MTQTINIHYVLQYTCKIKGFLNVLNDILKFVIDIHNIVLKNKFEIINTEFKYTYYLRLNQDIALFIDCGNKIDNFA